jgi:hypothetical protein
MLLGGVSGAIIGLFFHRDDWMGGYDSYRRRLTRLGHISFFGLGFINLFFGLTVIALSLSGGLIPLAGRCLIIGAVTMPLCCFLSAWRRPYRHLFFIPVISVLTGIVLLLYSWKW